MRNGWRVLVVVTTVACGRVVSSGTDGDTQAPASDASIGSMASDAGSQELGLPCEVTPIPSSALPSAAFWSPCANGANCEQGPSVDVVALGAHGVMHSREATAGDARFVIRDLDGAVIAAWKIPSSCYATVSFGAAGAVFDHRAHYFVDGAHPAPPRMVSIARWDDPNAIVSRALPELRPPPPWAQTQPGSSLSAACDAERGLLVGARTLFDKRCDAATLQQFVRPLDVDTFVLGPELGPFAGVSAATATDDLFVTRDDAVRIVNASGTDDSLLSPLAKREWRVDVATNEIVSLGPSSECGNASTLTRTLAQTRIGANGAPATTTIATREHPCFEGFSEPALVAHAGYVAFGVPPVLVRRSDGATFSAAFDYPIRGGTAWERVLYVDAHWLVTSVGTAVRRRPVAALSPLP